MRQTSATFLRIVGSELIQKYLGDGPKLVRVPSSVECRNESTSDCANVLFSLSAIIVSFFIVPIFVLNWSNFLHWLKTSALCLELHFWQVREIFRLADQEAPSIVFIDEIDAVRMTPSSAYYNIIISEL